MSSRVSGGSESEHLGGPLASPTAGLMAKTRPTTAARGIAKKEPKCELGGHARSAGGVDLPNESHEPSPGAGEDLLRGSLVTGLVHVRRFGCPQVNPHPLWQRAYHAADFDLVPTTGMNIEPGIATHE